MPLVVLTRYLAVPGQEDRLRTALEAMIEPSLQACGCLTYEPYVDPNRPGRMLNFEEWADARALREHLTGGHHRHLRQVLDLVLAEPETIWTLTPPGAAGP
ncbi:putative quinol monooxygenase [Streptomyces sp. Ru72]|uniref:putative quinol monooxygenase n=1 Tax=Streptomyces sp. Ru72 TaxID=2080747 RepID=UPI000CDD1B1A|nr:putative quinol monooxygenase [Streptomyces sp. Ru72]POX53381.1 antibiotic biosynthesis monooxygenase [Streptomyces sp. Ru72]